MASEAAGRQARSSRARSVVASERERRRWRFRPPRVLVFCWLRWCPGGERRKAPARGVAPSCGGGDRSPQEMFRNYAVRGKVSTGCARRMTKAMSPPECCGQFSPACNVLMSSLKPIDLSLASIRPRTAMASGKLWLVQNRILGSK